MESLSNTFWVFYFILISFTLITSLIYWVKQRFSGLAAIGIILSLLIPLVSFVYSAQRNTGNEYVYLKEQLFSSEWLAVGITIGYVFIIGWTLLVLIDGTRELYHVPYINKKISPFISGKLLPLWKKGVYYVRMSKVSVQRKLQNKRRKKDSEVEEAKREVQ